MQLFLDCDGVLADFDAAFLAQFGHAPRAYEAHRGTNIFWQDIRKEAPNFYHNLPLMPDARSLYDGVKHLRPIILTGCPAGGWAELQKLAWAAEYFPGVPMITCKSKDKRIYCQPGDVLVGDWPQYRNLWESAGGIFIQHTSAVTSIAALRSHFTPIEVIASAASAKLSLETRASPQYAMDFCDDIVKKIQRALSKSITSAELNAALAGGGSVRGALSYDQETLLRDKLDLWRASSVSGSMDMRDYNRRAAAALEALLGPDLLPEEQSLAEALGLGVGGRGVVER